MFVEINTYRYHGHSMSDPGTTYRDREEINEVRKTKDPILQIKNIMLDHKVLNEKDIKDLDKWARSEVDKATEQARADPEPVYDDIWKDVYDKDEDYIRGVEQHLSINPY